MKSRRLMKIYTIVEKPGTSKGLWLEIGIASENRDGTISGKLDAFPANGTIHIRDDEKKRRRGEGSR